MSLGFTPHAQDRARERYGLELQPEDMRAILADCQSGKALCGKSTEASHGFIMKFGGKTIVPLLNTAKTFIITFLPDDYFVAGHRRKHLQIKGVAKQKSKTARHPVPKGYRRKRITVADVEDEAL